ncbi:MAG TPA: peptidoglycan DD-metalloendopeptidase family protein [Ilumatobacter sp.]|nr:peptidoglycan DD-metalloendopeptidase family protein [Ilumatobacter sp.]
MRRKHHLIAATAAAVAMLLGGTLMIPLLAVSGGTDGMPECPFSPAPAGAAAPDGTPTILGPSTLTVAQLVDWWDTRRGTQPARLTIGVHDAIALYIAEATAEGVRGDLMLAQSIVETGWFTNTDTAINNFAGIGHYDDRSSGYAYPDARTGIRAQVQLLKKFAAGNDTELVNPDLGVRAGRHATTWGGLAGTWATATNYYDVIADVYRGMLTHADLDATAIAPAPGRCDSQSGQVVYAGQYALPLAREWYDTYLHWFTSPHHTYPAIDLMVPEGTPIYSVSSGTVFNAPIGTATCGPGVSIQGDDGVRYIYCHGLDGGPLVRTGDRVTAGQHIMNSGNTGRSSGPHLHFEIRVTGEQRCPQQFLVGIATGQPVHPQALPASGCWF